MRKLIEYSSLATTNSGACYCFLLLSRTLSDGTTFFKKIENTTRIIESKAAVMKTRLYASEEGNEYPLSEIMVFINT